MIESVERTSLANERTSMIYYDYEIEIDIEGIHLDNQLVVPVHNLGWKTGDKFELSLIDGIAHFIRIEERQ